MSNWLDYGKDLTTDNAVQIIKASLNSAARDFVAVGFYLKAIRDNKAYEKDGYETLQAFAKERLNMSSSSVSRYMAINDKFSIDGNSPILAEQCKEFGIGQFQEMLPLSEELVETVTPDMTVKQIREMKHKKVKPKKEIATSQLERVSGEVIAKEVVRTECSHDKSIDCNISNAKDVAHNIGIECKGLCCVSCQEDCGARCNYSAHEDSNNDKCVAKMNETVIKTESTARQHLENEIRREEDTLEQMRDYWMENQPDTLLKHETMLSAYKFMLNDMDCQEQEPVRKEQPELPILKNNDQRKEFIDNYINWPLWIDQTLTGERYYRYDLGDNVAMVVKVSHKHKWNNYKQTKEMEYGAEQYYLLGVLSQYGVKGSIFKPDQSRTFIECNCNRSTLVDYLREFQKGAK